MFGARGGCERSRPAPTRPQATAATTLGASALAATGGAPLNARTTQRSHGRSKLNVERAAPSRGARHTLERMHKDQHCAHRRVGKCPTRTGLRSARAPAVVDARRSANTSWKAPPTGEHRERRRVRAYLARQPLSKEGVVSTNMVRFRPNSRGRVGLASSP